MGMANVYRPSALEDVNVRRLLAQVKQSISDMLVQNLCDNHNDNANVRAQQVRALCVANAKHLEDKGVVGRARVGTTSIAVSFCLDKHGRPEVAWRAHGGGLVYSIPHRVPRKLRGSRRRVRSYIRTRVLGSIMQDLSVQPLAMPEFVHVDMIVAVPTAEE